MTSVQRPQSPYRGLSPYEEDDARFFFGRDRDTRLLIANLFASRLTLVYGPSGVGKTSLLQAGLMHALRARDDVAAVLVRDWHALTPSSLADMVVEATKTRKEKDASFGQALGGAAEATQRRVMVILDQFEEYLAHYRNEAVEQQLVEAIASPHPFVSFLVSLRDDAVARLDRFEGQIPDLFENYLRIEHLSRSDAEEAIVRPLVEYDLLFGGGIRAEQELVDAVLDDPAFNESRAPSLGIGAPAGVGGIQTTYLQIVMSRLWSETQRSGSTTIERAVFENLGSAERIFFAHFDDVLGALGEEQQEIAARAFEYLVTPTGWKIALPAADLAAYVKIDVDVLDSVLRSLAGEEARILRPVPLPGREDRAYEIYHDVLAKAILEWRALRERRATTVRRTRVRPIRKPSSWAIVVGIDRYWNEQACLKGAVRDALTMRTWLLDEAGGNVPEENLALILSPVEGNEPKDVQAAEATNMGIVNAIDGLIKKSKGEGERLYFFYAGHGLTARINQRDENALVCSDFTEVATTNSIALRSLWEFFETVQFQDQFFFVDACRNIPWENVEFEIGRWSLPRKRDPGLPPTQQFILYATSPGLRGQEMQEAGNERGAFTEVLIGGLSGAGEAIIWSATAEKQNYEVRWERLVNYVKNELESRRLALPQGVAQDLFQVPQDAGARGGAGRERNPALASFTDDAIPNETLEILLRPEEAVPLAEVTILDETATSIEVRSGLTGSAVEFTLPPKSYAIHVTAPGYERAAAPVALYGSRVVPLELVRSVEAEPATAQS
jgi:conflict system STAND superfamily ATPase/caspase domain-containing protein